MNLIQRIEWRLYKEQKRAKLKNCRPTILSSNCIATYIYHDLKLPFYSPTINLSFDMNDYVRFLENLDWYLDQPVVPCVDAGYDYPCGMIGDVMLRFNHYRNLEEAVCKWDERKGRIDRNNLFVIGIEGDGCTYETMQRFNALPFSNKVLLTHKPYPELGCAYYLPGFERYNSIGQVTGFMPRFFIRRYLDQFDYISFLNGKGVHT